MRGISLKEAFESKLDNFLFMRFFAAGLVIYGHSYAISNPASISGPDIFAKYIGGTYSGTIAVQIFFVISGFLITASYLNRHNALFFIKSRVLRIFPALIVAVLLSALVIGPLVTTYPLQDYFTDRQVWKYIYVNISLYTNEWFLPGVFTDNPRQGVNGSLWTLPAEIRMYITTGVLGILGILKRRLLFNLFAIGIVLTWYYDPSWLIMVGHQSHYKVIPFFLLGALLYVNRDIIYLNTYVLLALLVLCFLTHGGDYFKLSFGLFLTYFTIWACYVPNLRYFNRFGDYSYGLYVYAFPIQQTIRHFTGPLHPMELFAYSATATLVVAMISWHLIEHPVLRLKNRVFLPARLHSILQSFRSRPT